MRQKEINNEWMYSTVCAVIFLPMAARLVNTKNLSMSAVRHNVSAKNECFALSFIPQLDLCWCGIVWLFFPLWQQPSMHLWSVSHCVIKLDYHTRPALTSIKRMTRRLTSISLAESQWFKGLRRVFMYLSCLNTVLSPHIYFGGSIYGGKKTYFCQKFGLKQRRVMMALMIWPYGSVNHLIWRQTSQFCLWIYTTIQKIGIVCHKRESVQ